MSAGVLKLNVKCCGPVCTCQPNPLGITANKWVDQPTKGFTKYVHSITTGGTFTLNGKVDGSKVGSAGKSTNNVRSVSVYYWNGAPDRPILIEIITNSGGGTTTFYGKNGIGGHLSWLNGPVKDKTLIQALDDFNCKINNVVPFDIQDSQSGSILNDSNSTCIESKRITQSNLLQNPPGSDYVSKAYIITASLNTGISRVTYNGKPTDISTPNETIDLITLYSYPGSIEVPLMIEFKPSNNRISRWFHSKNTGEHGKEWKEHGNDPGFYTADSDPKPTAKLSEKLDEVLCTEYGNVTLDLSHARKSGNYCCSEHGSHKGTGRISVTPGEITVNGETKTDYYKHAITDSRYGLAGIYYNDSGVNMRKNVKLSGVSFPVSVNGVYFFYCAGEEPSLIYINSDSIMTKGWYKKDTGEWKWISELIGINSNDIEGGLTCAKWRKLFEILKGFNCSDLQECSYTDHLKQAKEENELKLQEEEANNERENAKKQKQKSTHTPTKEDDPVSQLPKTAMSAPQEPGPPPSGAKPESVEKGDRGESGDSKTLGPQGPPGPSGNKGEYGHSTGKTKTRRLIDKGSSSPWYKDFDFTRLIGNVIAPLAPQAKAKVESQDTVKNTTVQTGGSTPVTPPKVELTPASLTPDATVASSQSSGNEFTSPSTTSQTQTAADGTDPHNPPVRHSTEESLPEAQPAESTKAAFVGPEVAAAGSVLWTTFGASSGTLAGAGGLTGFGWWLYKRSKGDPWVRQI
ncbi:hypothetical protein BEWA_047170 [Theileria equi strain WA]|uniref:Uncharacterized protein n=1 Tax=Theileria equi strain WA TaxID=1537102 RepID=L1LAV1_THEEQ|nr:hypothetical protein BEWA_047170 [Theileria equi strain WA]EKX72253.1 hypothetical protein BEWA_047170 [Theileria equi strain WA]|eukprot:XP_004831705.1 hypothetical protein BEWA_047170 [Theileria equi strain WA]